MELSTALFTAAQTRELDRMAIEEKGIPGIHLMKRAGRAAFNLILECWPDCEQLTVFCGSGNNGGDGYIIAALAAEKNIPVRVVQVAPASKLTGDARLAFEYAEQAAVTMGAFSDCIQLDSGVIVDAMLGTGFSGQVREPVAQAIRLINHSGLPLLAVDIPSGLCADTGSASAETIAADITITFIGRKQGLFTGRGPALAGEVFYDSLGIPDEVFESLNLNAELLQLEQLMMALPPRQRDAHKGDFGHVMVIGGDHGYGGAAAMSAEAALRVGAGLVSVATRPEHVPALLARRPELMVKGVVSGQELEPLLGEGGPTILVIGPGLGQSPWSEQLLQKAVASGLPMVLDADALNLISQGRVVSGAIPIAGGEQWVLTPHPGEAARLLGLSNTEIQADRFAAVRALQQKFCCPVMLKGSGSLVVAASDQPVGVCTQGNPGMASGGMGDVLSGVIGGLLAQRLSSDQALPLAVCLHGMAADMAAATAGERGLLATDLFAPLQRLVNQDTYCGGI